MKYKDYDYLIWIRYAETIDMNALANLLNGHWCAELESPSIIYVRCDIKGIQLRLRVLKDKGIGLERLMNQERAWTWVAVG